MMTCPKCYPALTVFWVIIIIVIILVENSRNMESWAFVVPHVVRPSSSCSSSWSSYSQIIDTGGTTAPTLFAWTRRRTSSTVARRSISRSLGIFETTTGRRRGFHFLLTTRSMSQTMSGDADLPSQPEVVVRQSTIENNNPRYSPRSARGGGIIDLRYSEFLQMVQNNQIEKVTFSSTGDQLLGFSRDGMRIKLDALPNDPDLLTELAEHKVDVTVLPEERPLSLTENLVSLIFPLAIFAGLFFLARRRGRNMLGGAIDPMRFGKSKAEVRLIPDTGVSFDDVAGCDGAKLELEEVVDFLKNSESYTKNGCKIPRGVILDGPPGTGKTLLAKAVAGEAGVPFISISGSEFVEMFVGVGASRVRDIFAQAKKNAPCIIFIDEIDAVGRQRGAGYAGGNDEREQTVNQILVELDGFEGNPGVITMAATNRVDILDQALLRPGRFDRKITVDLPNFEGRTKILAVHSRGKPLEPDIDLEAIARRTPGFSGAQLENLMNEAAISAARLGKRTIGWEQIDGAVDRIIVGLEKKGGASSLSPRHNEIVAYHEAGHAIVGALTPDYDQVQKISIIPRSNGAGGITFFAPQEGRLELGLYSRQYLESQLSVALGGRLAEELIFGKENVTTGASNDFQQVSNIAKRMVKEWGMSEKIGLVTLSNPQSGGPFMGKMLGIPRTHWGRKILDTVDDEVEHLVNRSYERAKNILETNMQLLHHLAKTLIEREVVSAEEFNMMLIEFDAKTVSFDISIPEDQRDTVLKGTDYSI